MQRKFIVGIITVLILLLLVDPALAGGGHDHGHGHGHGHDEGHDEEPSKGPHGGKLLAKEDFALELTIFEQGVPPQFRIYPFKQESPISPEKVQAKVELLRFGGQKDTFTFTPQGEYLTSPATVEEPHSFAVSVSASYEGRDYQWNFESHEGRTELSDEALKVAKLGIDVVGPQEIASVARVYGKLLPNENKVAHVVARFPGVVKEIRKELGDKVKKGEVLAVVESNQSLQPYEIRSQIDGQIIKRHATLGEFVSDSREIFVVVDLSEIWADFQVYRDDFGEVKEGQSITVDLGDEKEATATIAYISPVTDEATQSKLVRAVLSNTSGDLRAGLFVSGTISRLQQAVPLAVKREAIQTFRDWDVIFLTDGHVFQAMPVELGRRDSKYVEISSGVSAGAKYVTHNSYIVKADIEKSGASHDH